jgi:hypothetical protein
MGIGSWWKKLMKREDEAAMERAEERSYETPAERRATSGDMEGLEADTQAARAMREGNVEDVERFADEDDRP